MNSNNIKNTLDEIPNAEPYAKRIVGLIKEDGKVTGYKLSNNALVTKNQAINLARHGEIAGVGVAHRGNTEYLKAIPNGNQSDNLSNLPTIIK